MKTHNSLRINIFSNNLKEVLFIIFLSGQERISVVNICVASFHRLPMWVIRKDPTQQNASKFQTRGILAMSTYSWSALGTNSYIPLQKAWLPVSTKQQISLLCGTSAMFPFRIANSSIWTLNASIRIDSLVYQSDLGKIRLNLITWKL